MLFEVQARAIVLSAATVPIMLVAAVGRVSGQEAATRASALDRSQLHGPEDRGRDAQLMQYPDTDFNGLRTRTNARIRVAITDPEALWLMLTDPESSFSDRGAAAYQGATVFPYDWVPRLMKALGELRAEEKEHNWGLRPNPVPNGAWIPAEWWCDVLSRLRAWTEVERSRTILGHPWRAPGSVQGWEPQAHDLLETEAAPWPLQVKIALEILLREAALRTQGPRVRGRARNEEWLESALRLGCNDENEALLFVEAASAVHPITERVLSRYRTLLLDPRFERSSERLVWGLGSMARAPGAAPETITQLHVLLYDAMTGPAAERTRHRAAYEVRNLREQWSEKGRAPLRLEPATLILLLSHRGLVPKPPMHDSHRPNWEHQHLAAYLLAACAAMDHPPFTHRGVPGYDINPNTAPYWIEKYRAWFDVHRADLERAAAREKPALDAARARLVELAGQ